jgi:hypothetical protein
MGQHVSNYMCFFLVAMVTQSIKDFVCMTKMFVMHLVMS